jgi:hypothetical protein
MQMPYRSPPSRPRVAASRANTRSRLFQDIISFLLAKATVAVTCDDPRFTPLQDRLFLRAQLLRQQIAALLLTLQGDDKQVASDISNAPISDIWRNPNWFRNLYISIWGENSRLRDISQFSNTWIGRQ